MSQDPSASRRILPQDAQSQQASQMGSFSSYTPQQFPQREMQKNYVFVDEHNRHKRLKVMRACEGCRRRKIKCDAATTNTWPCSACIRLKLHCVRPNGYDGGVDGTGYDAPLDPGPQYQQMQMPQQLVSDPSKDAQALYGAQAAYHDMAIPLYQPVPFDGPQAMPMPHYVNAQGGMPLMDPSYSTHNVFPTPPMQQQQQTTPQQQQTQHQPQHHQQQQQQQQQQQPQQQQQQTHRHHSQSNASRADEPSPESYSPDSYQQQDLADLLGTLKVDETGAAPYLRNKASFRREESPAVEEEDDFDSILPPMPVSAGLKIRIPPPLMPDEATAKNYIDLYFTHVHSYVPVLDSAQFYQQWREDRDSISPLVLEAMFAIGGRLAEDPGDGQQWLALASRHADSFMDIPRLSTLQALLMILKAREAAPKRGYFYRSWMTVVQCVQMAKDLGLDEHFDDHALGRPCGSPPQECHLRTRIWQILFVCEVMVGTPQGRHDLAVDIDTVDFSIPRRVPGGDENEYQVSRNFTYMARIVRNVGNLSNVYLKLMKLRRLKEWGIEPEVQQLNHDFSSFMTELPDDLSINFPADGSPPYVPTSFLGNLHSYYYLSLILCHRPQLSFLDPSSSDGQWKHHMMRCYSSAKSLCRLQEATLNQFGMIGLQCMQRGFSFTVYAGLSCIVLHIVAIVSPDPELNTDAREFFERHMRIMEKVMDVWVMPELQRQIDTVREAFSADVRKPFVLKPSFPYGSPHPSQQSPPRNSNPRYQQIDQATTIPHSLETRSAPQVRFAAHPPTPPISAGTADNKSDTASTHSLLMMQQPAQSHVMQQSIALTDAPQWNPARLFEQWSSTFAQAEPPPVQELPVNASMSNQQISPQQYSAAAPSTYMTPAMWQESVASVYEGGLKRGWDFEGHDMLRR